MPTVLRIGRFGFYFFSNEGREPAHIHVKLNPVQLAWHRGFNARELNRLEWLVDEHRDLFLEAWHEHFGP
ncbi:MAG TPA: DUF4160 domain-containing protein [Gemmataceae bacterium]|nr:DUF4160 domain-containing protein [Gemmataceae bacterium]